jgi:hypothetical protein
MTAGIWLVSVERPGSRAEWDCATLGAPDARDLLPTRRPSSGDFSRHIPRRAYAATTGTAIELESGLEHDLLRWLDFRADVTWLVGQPVCFHFLSSGQRKTVVHTPDLLSQHDDGSVVLWDARPRRGRDAKFEMKVELTAETCSQVGWRHEAFEGVPTTTRMNLLWLSGYRRPMPWHARWTGELERLLRVRPRSVSDLRAFDDGGGELHATMWHLIATGSIHCDLSRPIRDSSTLSWSSSCDGSGGGSRGPQTQPTAWTQPRPARSDALASTRLQRAGACQDFCVSGRFSFPVWSSGRMLRGRG